MYKQEKSEYTRRIFRDARAGGTALRRVKADREKLSQWNPSELGDVSKLLDKGHDNRYVQEFFDYFSNNHVGALEHIVKDKFQVGYHIYGDVTRDAVLGENTNSVLIDIGWDTLDIDVELYRGQGMRMTQKELSQSNSRNGISYRQEVVKFTSWDPIHVNQATTEHMSDIENLLKVTAVDQNKYTRLVKGFLIYLYLLEEGPRHVTKHLGRTIPYTLAGVLNSFRQHGRAYVHNSLPESDIHSVMLLSMGEEFPPPFIDSHISIPADGPEVFLVAVGGEVSPEPEVILSAPNALASIIKYASDVGVSSILQSCLITACSLKQNRYFSKVKLPQVVSYCDLMIKQFVILDPQSNAKCHITKHMGISLGRVHQMLAFATAKDVITAAELSTDQGYDWHDSVVNYLSMQESRVARMGGYFTELKVLDATPQFKWLSCLSDADIDDISSLSILETLWLCDRASKIVENGAISCLKKGYNELTDENIPVEILRKEINAANVMLDETKMPKGDFIVESSSIRSLEIRGPRRREVMTARVVMVHPCDTKFRVGRTQRKKRRGESTSLPGYSEDISSSPPRVPSSNNVSIVSETPSPDPTERFTTPASHRRTLSKPIDLKFMPARLAREATGLETKSEAKAAEMVMSSPFEQLRKRTDIRETSVKLMDIGINDAMTEDEIGANVLVYVKGGGSVSDKRLMELGIRHQLACDGFSKKEQVWVLNLLTETNSLRQAVARDVKGIIEIVKDKSTTLEPIESDNVAISNILKSVKFSHKSSTKLDRGKIKDQSNTDAWLKLVSTKLGTDTRNVCGLRAAYGVADILQKCTKLRFDDIEEIYRLTGGTSVNYMPKDITPWELRQVVVTNRQFRDNPASMKKRDLTQEDGNWLDIAVCLERPGLEFDALKILMGKFFMSNKELYTIKTRYNMI